MLTPVGIGIILAVIVVITTLVYWKRAPIKAWLRSWTADEVELGGGPAKFKLKRKDADEEEKSPSPQAGVDFGEDGDFSGANVKAAGRDIRQRTTATESPKGEAPRVSFGKRGKFRDTEIEVAGRDIVEDEGEEA
jgi:hypothetical protein